MIDIPRDPILNGRLELEEVRQGLLSFASTGFASGYNRAVQKSTDRALEGVVEPMAQAYALEHVGGRASDIEAKSVGWSGTSYVGGLDADDVVVLSHEHGSGSFNSRTPSMTVDGRTGYRISPKDGSPMAFEVGGKTIFAEFVIHPGVDEEAFMRDAARDSKDELLQSVADETHDALRDAVK